MNRKRRTKLTPNQRAYKKEVKRIKNFLHRARKRGYEFSDNVLPPQPKRITQKKLDEIKALRPKGLYDNAAYYDAITGETFTGHQGRRLERYRASLKAKKTKEEKKKKGKTTPKGKGKTTLKEKGKTTPKGKGKTTPKGKGKTISNEKGKITPKEKGKTDSSVKNYPTVNFVDVVGERLTHLDYVMEKLSEADGEDDYRYIWKRNAKSNDYNPSYFYSNVWSQTIQKYEAVSALNELEKYVQENALEITNCIDVVFWASKKEEEGNWQRLSSRLLILLKGGEIPTISEAQTLGELQEQNDLVGGQYED